MKQYLSDLKKFFTPMTLGLSGGMAAILFALMMTLIERLATLQSSEHYSTTYAFLVKPFVDTYNQSVWVSNLLVALLALVVSPIIIWLVNVGLPELVRHKPRVELIELPHDSH